LIQSEVSKCTLQ